MQDGVLRYMFVRDLMLKEGKWLNVRTQIQSFCVSHEKYDLIIFMILIF